ncbi:hypothetical protein CLHOM_18040 [Clostridium homopropionicum DSM 5847]|uniref:Uncharacterized protein n=1 Tax=Clostridium homopropionicum DSM 5847 TaxID=1121318 RepID=A0A0L6Z9S9_9CLOT|nr:hypothetical protein [Clostridium homopropionicum]KOA19715.1 hypothetical protein CLHOM_18040 [Clostridium homopropionicum DSM 5847]SFF79264.1 hypothetical protein SAMN04488501_102190 [Clostridium homopropionicum]
MSQCSFIATDYELSEIDNLKLNSKVITVGDAIKLGIKPHELMPWEKMNPNDEVLIVNDEFDMGELVIKKDSSFERNVSWYTSKPFIYSIEFAYTESRAEQLLEYLKENLLMGHILELWTVWLDEKQNIKPDFYKYDELSIDLIKKIYDTRKVHHTIRSCTIIER